MNKNKNWKSESFINVSWDVKAFWIKINEQKQPKKVQLIKFISHFLE